MISIAFLLTGCKWFQPTAYFFISNTSVDKKLVDIQVSISNEIVLKDNIKYTNVRPDLTHTPYVSLPKGKYIIQVTADSGQTEIKKTINLSSDRWIFISYSYKPPIDTREKNNLKKLGYDTSWVNPQVRGYRSRLTIHIVDKEPVLM